MIDWRSLPPLSHADERAHPESPPPLNEKSTQGEPVATIWFDAEEPDSQRFRVTVGGGPALARCRTLSEAERVARRSA
jgi:hypothetical protein